jgi:hypothetical protein
VFEFLFNALLVQPTALWKITYTYCLFALHRKPQHFPAELAHSHFSVRRILCSIYFPHVLSCFFSVFGSLLSRRKSCGVQLSPAPVAQIFGSYACCSNLRGVLLKEICQRLTGDGGGHVERELGWRRTSWNKTEVEKNPLTYWKVAVSLHMKREV